jgi:hypothetical protein
LLLKLSQKIKAGVRNLGGREGTLQELKLVEIFDSVDKGYESVEVLCSNFTELLRKS